MYKILLFCLLISFSGLAQENTFGVLGGATLSSYTASEFFADTDPVVGVFLGAYRGISLNNTLDIEPGIYFSQKGIRYESAYAQPSSAQHTLSYLLLPVVLRKRVINNFSVHAGIYGAGLVHGYYKWNDSGRSTVHETWGLFEDNRNEPDGKLNWGGLAGVRYVFPSHLVINASYERNKGRWLRRVANEGPVNQTITLAVGYQW